MRRGNAEVAAIYRGNQSVQAVYRGDTLVYQSWTPYDWSTTFTGVALQRTAWTLVTSHTVTADPRQAQIEFTADWIYTPVGDSSARLRVLVNGTTVAESHGATFQFPAPISVDVNLSAGDVVRFEARGLDNSNANYRRVDGSASITSIT